MKCEPRPDSVLCWMNSKGVLWITIRHASVCMLNSYCAVTQWKFELMELLARRPGQAVWSSGHKWASLESRPLCACACEGCVTRRSMWCNGRGDAWSTCGSLTAHIQSCSPALRAAYHGLPYHTGFVCRGWGWVASRGYLRKAYRGQKGITPEARGVWNRMRTEACTLPREVGLDISRVTKTPNSSFVDSSISPRTTQYPQPTTHNAQPTTLNPMLGVMPV